MPLRTKLQIAMTLFATAGATAFAVHLGSGTWLPFWLLLIAVLLSSGFKVGLPRGDDGSMSLNFPFILLGIVQLSPLQAMLLAGISVAAQSRLRVDKLFSLVQISFNVANAMLSTACALLLFGWLGHLHVATAPALAAGAVAYFLCNTLALASVLASSTGVGVVPLWRTEFPWYLPFYIVGAALAATVHWMSYRFGWGTALLLIPVVYTLYRAYVGQVTRIQERQQHLEETEALQLRTIEGLAMAIEAKDQNTHDHLFRVRHYVKAVGKAMQLSAIELKALETASFLHDIGKLAVPEHIINKPGKLTPDEFEKMKIHPAVGADILERVRFPYPVVPIVRSHHERWDGTGYPDGLQGDEIPIGARILTVVDCFDALISDRPYRKGMRDSDALALIHELSGKQFDPQIVAAFQRCYATAQAELCDLVPVSFTPLNKDVDVSRGPAPGAGFEVGSYAGDTKSQQESLSAQSRTGALRFVLAQNCKSAAAKSIESSLRSLQDVIPFDACACFLRTGDELRCSVTAIAAPPEVCFELPTMQLGEGISGWVAQNGKPLFNANAEVEPGCPACSGSPPLLQAGLSVPLCPEGEDVLGVITLYSKRRDAFSRDHLASLQAIQAELSLQLLRLEKDLDPGGVDSAPIRTETLSAESFLVLLEAAISEGAQIVRPCYVALWRLLPVEGSPVRSSTPETPMEEERFLTALAHMERDWAAFARLSELRFMAFQPACGSTSKADWHREAQTRVEEALRRAGLAGEFTAQLGSACFPEDGNTLDEVLHAAEYRSARNKSLQEISPVELGIPAFAIQGGASA